MWSATIGPASSSHADLPVPGLPLEVCSTGFIPYPVSCMLLQIRVAEVTFTCYII